MALRVGSRVGPYKITGVIGEGGMAAVYRAYDAGLDRHVALKVLAAELLRDGQFAERFKREAKVSAKLEHPHILPIHAFGIDGGLPWMAIRLVLGGTASAMLRRGDMTRARAVQILRDAAGALDYAHGKGIVHRDVKPQNLLLDENGRAYLADFGIARMLEGATPLTRTGVLAGTPQYMAPEQAKTGDLTPQVDVYALGVVAYEFLTGEVPFRADTPVAVLMSHLMDPVPNPDPARVPPGASAALLRALAKEREQRWPTASSFVDALEMGLGLTPRTPTSVDLVAPTVTSQITPSGFTQATTSSPVPATSTVRGRTQRPLRRLAILVGLVILAGVGLLLMGPSAREAKLREGAGSTESTPPATLPAVTERTPTPAPPASETAWTNPIDGLDYVEIPAGEFQMGCPTVDETCYVDEKPRRTLSLGGFWLGRTEVSVGAYKRFATATHRSLPSAPGFNVDWGRDDLAMSAVTWDDAVAFCEWSGGRLPTEAEWEAAARGGRDGAVYPWGNDAPVCRKDAPNGARFNDRADCKDTTPDPIGSYPANGFGVRDAAGGVWEWCADWYASGAYSSPDLTGPNDGRDRVIRGGAMNSRATGLRLSLRNKMVPGTRSIYVGIRCARDTGG